MIKYQEPADAKSNCETMKPSNGMPSLQAVSMNNMNCVHSPYRFSNDDLAAVVKSEHDRSLEVHPYHNNNNNNANFIMTNQDFNHLDKGNHMYMPLASALTEL